MSMKWINRLVPIGTAATVAFVTLSPMTELVGSSHALTRKSSEPSAVVPATNRKRSAEAGPHDHSDPNDRPSDNHDKEEGHSHDDGHEHQHGETHEDQQEQKNGENHKDDAKHDHGHDDGVRLNREEIKQFGIQTEAAEAGPIEVTVERPAKIRFNEDLLAHVVPRVAGIAETVAVAEGDRVEEGQIIAVLDSRELADAKALHLAGVERQILAQEEFDRQKTLREKNITAEKSFLAARTALAEARIALTSATQKLYALGYDEATLRKIASDDNSSLTKYVMRAPLSGIVVKRHLVRGEFIETERNENEREVFTIADVSSVWVDIAIYPHDLPKVRGGQTVRIVTDHGSNADAIIAFVTPHVSEDTRTATARVILSNRDMQFRPGQFVRAFIEVSGENVAVRVPKTAVQTVSDRQVVFVKDDARFQARPVRLGRESTDYVEVTDGIQVGDAVVVEGSFVLKAQLAKADFDDGHAH